MSVGSEDSVDWLGIEHSNVDSCSRRSSTQGTCVNKKVVPAQRESVD